MTRVVLVEPGSTTPSAMAGDLDRLAADVVHDLRVFTGRSDYVHLALAHLADVRHPVDRSDLDAIVDYTEQRGIRLVSAAARRMRGLILADSADLEGGAGPL
ncbi:MAG: hypothetical protein ABIP77_09825 [Candidatus Limnocylindrales bacterium]